jgi:hypothetical protein
MIRGHGSLSIATTFDCISSQFAGRKPHRTGGPERFALAISTWLSQTSIFKEFSVNGIRYR